MKTQSEIAQRLQITGMLVHIGGDWFPYLKIDFGGLAGAEVWRVEPAMLNAMRPLLQKRVTLTVEAAE